MKTIEKSTRDILDVLPEPFRNKAILNCIRFEFIPVSLSNAINYAFTWSETSEYHSYWQELYTLTQKKIIYIESYDESGNN